MSTRKISSMTEDDLAALIRSAVRAEFSAAGLRVDATADQDEAREDFRFLRKMRRNTESVGAKVAMLTLAGLVGFVGLLLSLGVQSWFRS